MDKLSKLFYILENDLKELEIKSKNVFGFRERLIIERTLFLILSSYCKTHHKIQIIGFTDFYKNEILSIISKNEKTTNHKKIIKKIFDLKFFLQELSNENAYIRGDALSKVGLEKKHIYKIITAEIESIRRLISKLNY